MVGIISLTQIRNCSASSLQPIYKGDWAISPSVCLHWVFVFYLYFISNPEESTGIYFWDKDILLSLLKLATTQEIFITQKFYNTAILKYSSFNEFKWILMNDSICDNMVQLVLRPLKTSVLKINLLS